MESRLQETGPARLTVKEIKEELKRLGVSIPAKAKKAELVEQLTEARKQESTESMFVSPEDAALEKARAGENLAVEHIAELGPGQARRARSRNILPDLVPSKQEKKISIKREAQAQATPQRKSKRKKSSDLN
mmetsp:Transcript_17682/g.36625  ORF Transcript_17682/g.36625 Transcript_17682/m.36625 type:complete len:132 (-) Transcript_17682:50-445(-)